MNSQVLDAHLVKRYINGEESVLQLLIERHQNKIKVYIYSKVRDRDVTEDLFQDTFVKVIKTLRKGSYNEEGKFLPWVMRIAQNLVVDYFRKSNRLPKANTSSEFNIFSVISDESLHVEERLVKSQIDQDICNLVQLLPEDQREVVEMRMYKDMSFKEISETTGVSINTALGRMRYAIQNLRKQMELNHLELSA